MRATRWGEFRLCVATVTMRVRIPRASERARRQICRRTGHNRDPDIRGHAKGQGQIFVPENVVDRIRRNCAMQDRGHHAETGGGIPTKHTHKRGSAFMISQRRAFKTDVNVILWAALESGVKLLCSNHFTHAANLWL